MLLLDTHVLIWFAEDSPRLGARTIGLVDRALGRDEVMVSAVSFWEVAMLLEKGRLDLDIPATAMRQKVLQLGIHEVPLSGSVAISAATLPDFHGDPADRFIVASAIAGGATLVTADSTILKWKDQLKRQDARR
ncbi:MAG TPA: type II toxin-antitoxin system VapC family toxin [Candidatus Acidoferrales bacterium]|nr:type II toxin-antitoxin system VapC family toxin [Candidatus Acidoferrales bacterium]